MTTKKRSSGKKAAKRTVKRTRTAAKKAVRRATGTAKTSSVRRRASKRRQNNKSNLKHTAFSEPAFSLIDQAAGFIKRAVSGADQATVQERRIIRDHAMDFVDSASKRLMQAIDEEWAPSRRRR